MRPVLVIEQEVKLAGQGVLGRRLEASGLPVRTLRTWEEGFDGLRATDFSAVVPLGSNVSAWQEDEYPFLRAERELLLEAVEHDVPVLGICLGAQLLARALGGDVRRGSQPEFGWCSIELTQEAAGDPVVGHARGTVGVFQSHVDELTLPAGAVRLAASDGYPVQAFRAGRAWGVQFHPEVDYEQFAIWIARHPGYAEKLGYDEQAVHEAVARGAADADDRRFREGLFDRFFALVRDGRRG